MDRRGLGPDMLGGDHGDIPEPEIDLEKED